MKKSQFLSVFLILCLAFGFCGTSVLALEDPEAASPTVLVMDRTGGEVLFSRNADARIAPASTTKVMTVLLAVEAIEQGKAYLNDEVTATQSAMQGMIAEGSSAGITPGETMTLENLLYCAMIASANEACNIIAEYISGSVESFVDLMNNRAEELGCTGTHFANTHGLPDDNHYITAEDYSLIALEATRHTLFMKICGTDEIVIPATNKSGERNLSNSNALISAKSMYGSGFVYEGAEGIKTGHTNAAGYCLASAATRGDLSVLALVFGADSSAACFTDSTALLDWAFSSFSYQEVLKSTENIASVDVALGVDADYVNLRPSTSVTLLLPNDDGLSDFDTDIRVYALEGGEPLTAPVSAGQVLGEVTLRRDGRSYGTVKLVASSSVELSRVQFIRSQIRETTQTKRFKLIATAVVLFFLAYFVWVIVYRVKRVQYLRTKKESAAAVAAPAPASKATPRAGAHAAARKPAAKPDRNFFPGDDAAQKTTVLTTEKPAPKSSERPSPKASAPKEDLLNGAISVAKLEKPAPAKPATPEEQAERDYFEEFFRQNKDK